MTRSSRHVGCLLLLVAGLLSLVFAEAVPAAELFAGFPVLGDRSPKGAGGLEFVVLGDKTSGGEDKWPVFDRAVDTINGLKPDFVITVGDHIPGHMQDREKWDAEWQEFRQHAGRITVPCVMIPGNHDIANVECYRFWKECLGPTYFAFDYKDCHFLILNTEEDRIDGRGPVWQAMMAFAEKDLSQHKRSRHTFVFFHKPMWNDPRFEEDWARLSKALEGHRYTVVAGHEHYQEAEYRDGNLLMVQSATGAGVIESPVKTFGGFDSFGYVVKEGEEYKYFVVEPDGTRWPGDVAPAEFRKAIAFDLVRLDAALPEALEGPVATIHARVLLHNRLSERARVEVSVQPLDKCGWEAVLSSGQDVKVADGKLVFTRALDPMQKAEQPLDFRVPVRCLSTPPAVSWRVEYQGQWLKNESYPMSQENVLPIYPRACFKPVPEWQLVGPFVLGDIDTTRLPAEPRQANASFFKRFGPEDGYDAARVYEGERRWYSAKSLGRGLLNFNALMGTLDHALGYALCGIQSPVEQTVYAVVGGDNYVQVVLNGTLVEEGQNFGAPGGFTYVPLHLKAGWNTFIAKLINNRGDWFLRVLIADPGNNLRFARNPE